MFSSLCSVLSFLHKKKKYKKTKSRSAKKKRLWRKLLSFFVLKQDFCVLLSSAVKLSMEQLAEEIECICVLTNSPFFVCGLCCVQKKSS